MFLDTSDLKYEDVRLMLHHTCDSDPSRNHLPVYYFRICGADGRTVGWCDFRIGHSDYTYYAGNIGYQVEEAFRGHHYAGKAIIILLELAILRKDLEEQELFQLRCPLLQHEEVP